MLANQASLAVRTKTLILLAAVLTLTVCTRLYFQLPALPKWRRTAHHAGDSFIAQERIIQASHYDGDGRAPCQELDGGDSVLLVMRTGATEIRDKLPVHINTTFKCYQDLIIFSDYEETFEGHKVHDVLTAVSDDIKLEHPDFVLYQRLLAGGRDVLNQSELSGTKSYESGSVGKTNNEGWNLDKWKFLPMAVRTLELRPDAKWIVFVEPDTYLVWSNLLQWLKKLDPSEPVYYGSEVQIGDDVFAHGGSAFVMSKPALQRAADKYREKPKEWHELTAAHWAGDCILGRALHEAGVPLRWAWPLFQGGNPATMDYKEDKNDQRKLWCAPVSKRFPNLRWMAVSFMLGSALLAKFWSLC